MYVIAFAGAGKREYSAPAVCCVEWEGRGVAIASFVVSVLPLCLERLVCCLEAVKPHQGGALSCVQWQTARFGYLT